MRHLMLLTFLNRYEGFALWLFRLMLGGFLIYGVADNAGA